MDTLYPLTFRPLLRELVWGGHRLASLLGKPAPPDRPIRELAVTAFRDYLACPYRFYLRHVLRLESVDDRAEELDGAGFGGLLHEILRAFGEGPCRDSMDEEEIRLFLNRALDERASLTYGRHALAPVRVQIEQLRLRLDAFAKKQAEWAAAGWSIEYTEVPDRSQRAAFEVDGQPFHLRGRIDRIDVHRDTGERVIFDYKSSDSARSPEQTHCQADRWVDLQLPLYRHLARALGIEGPMKLGYILLPKDVNRIAFQLAGWSDEELEVADEVAREVVRAVRAGRFWPPAEPAPDYSEALAPICQDGVFEKRIE